MSHLVMVLQFSEISKRITLIFPKITAYPVPFRGFNFSSNLVRWEICIICLKADPNDSSNIYQYVVNVCWTHSIDGIFGQFSGSGHCLQHLDPPSSSYSQKVHWAHRLDSPLRSCSEKLGVVIFIFLYSSKFCSHEARKNLY